MKNISIIFIFCFLTASCQLREFNFNCGISEFSQIGINHLQPIVTAMEQYKKDNGRYPKEFSDLVPRYTDRIPIIITGREESIDEKVFKVLRNEKLAPGLKQIEADGSSFNMEFITTDDRFCLTGRNNLCEYSSQNRSWNCHQ